MGAARTTVEAMCGTAWKAVEETCGAAWKAVEETAFSVSEKRHGVLIGS